MSALLTAVARSGDSTDTAKLSSECADISRLVGIVADEAGPHQGLLASTESSAIGSAQIRESALRGRWEWD
jgi:hypothetical protein